MLLYHVIQELREHIIQADITSGVQTCLCMCVYECTVNAYCTFLQQPRPTCI